MRYCRECVLPDTRPGLVIGPDGVCNACVNHRARREEIDWRGRETAFRAVAEGAKARGARYDCVIPVSGGKDSTWQVVKCLEYGLHPVAVTWKTPARTAIGRKNLDNLVRLGVDHVDYQVNPRVESRFMLKALERFGSTAIPMHMAMFSIPLEFAVRFDIPLVVWGENSAFEYGSPEEALTGFRLDSRWLRAFGVTQGTTARDWVSDDLTEKDLTPYFGPDDSDLERKGILAVFLGYYFPWDVETSLRVAVAHGFRVRERGPKTGYYNYADIDDDFISIHHYLKWYKFGFTRLFDNLSLEIRNGRMGREEAIAALRRFGDQEPRGDIAKFCAFAGITRRDFRRIIERFRNTEIWSREEGVWKIPGFLVPGWEWK